MLYGVYEYGTMEYANELLGIFSPYTDIFPIYSRKKDFYVLNNDHKTEPQNTYNSQGQIGQTMNNKFREKRY